MADDDLLYRPAVDLARLIRARQLSPVELVNHVLDRIASLQPIINAFITVTAEQARAAAREAEAAVMRRDASGSLYGVPFSVKDLTYTKGVRTTMGSPIFETFVPDEDAVPVERLKRAGAILIGKTTTPEFGHKPYTDGPLFGVTRNPWRQDRTCGGSSGGAAAALASGMGPLALGTDGGGSIRIPAACCGVVGLKATLGRIPHIHAPDLFANNSYIGPMARTVDDAAALYDVIMGPDPRDPYALARLPELPALECGRLDNVRIAWAGQVGNEAVDPEVLAACEAAARQLSEAGAKVEPVQLDFRRLETTFLVILQSALHARLHKYLPKYETRIDPSLRKTMELGSRWTAADLAQAAFVRSEVFRAMQALFANHDFLVTPTLSAAAMAIDQDAFDSVIIAGEDVGSVRGAWYPYTYPFNLTGHPALSVPCGVTSEGLPIGLQIVGPWYAERRILTLAKFVELAGNWLGRRPPV